MARRSDHTREELAALVLGAAADIISEAGSDALTMRGIGQRIGYAAGSIYNAVGDLEAVLLLVDARTLGGLADALETLTPDAAAPQEAVLRMAQSYMDYVTAHGALWLSMLERDRAPGRSAPAPLTAQRERLLDTVSRALAPLFPEPAAAQRALASLWAALHGVASLAAGGHLAFASGAQPPADIARSIVLRYLTGNERTTGV